MEDYREITVYDPKVEDVITVNQPLRRNYEENPGVSGKSVMVMFTIIGVLLICGGIIFVKMNP
jgi:hypothetical protein